MLLTRAYDDRMYRAQRQGKTSFYMKCTGEEGGRRGPGVRARPQRHVFPTYRQQGLLIARDWPLVDMMCQVYSNSGDPTERPTDAGLVFQSRSWLSSRSRATSARSSARRSAGRWPRPTRAITASLPAGSAMARPPRRLPLRADLRLGLSRAGHPQRRQQPVGDLLLPGHRRRRRIHLRLARRSAMACRRCASTATTFSPSMRRPNGPPSAREPISARR